MARAKTVKKVELPDGFVALPGFSQKWDYEANPILEGIWGQVRTIQVVRGRKTEEAHVVDVQQDDGVSVAVWESAGLKPAFAQLEEGTRVRITYLGEGAIRKKGQNPPRLYSVSYEA